METARATPFADWLQVLIVLLYSICRPTPNAYTMTRKVNVLTDRR
jgi:hypothetical protein